MNLMRVNDSYHLEAVHKDVEKRISDGMKRTERYTKEQNNVLVAATEESGYLVRMHFTEDKEGSRGTIAELQKILVESYINSLINKGGK